MSEVTDETEEELYTEARVAESLGVPRARVKAVRDGLQEGQDWLMLRGRVVLTDRGLNEVMLALAPSAAKRETNGQLVKYRPRRAEVVVTKIPRNPHLVLGKIVRVADGAASLGPAGPNKGPVIGQVVRVKVKRNLNFIPGMEMPCYRESWDVWVLDRPCPRFRGRW